jgi:hypothetical protein
MTFELTEGLTDNIAVGVMLLTAVRPGGPALEYAGWRVLPHFYAPKSWNLPVDLGFIAELAFQNTSYDEDSRHVELRPVLGKQVGKVEIDFNPVFARALHGPGVRDGWGFEPAARFAYEMNKRFTPSVEYYASTGPLPGGVSSGQTDTPDLPRWGRQAQREIAVESWRGRRIDRHW